MWTGCGQAWTASFLESPTNEKPRPGILPERGQRSQPEGIFSWDGPKSHHPAEAIVRRAPATDMPVRRHAEAKGSAALGALDHACALPGLPDRLDGLHNEV